MNTYFYRKREVMKSNPPTLQLIYNRYEEEIDRYMSKEVLNSTTQTVNPPSTPASSYSLPEISEESTSAHYEKVYVAVGKSPAKSTALLRWANSHFQGTEICILHVHKPSPFIPTLLGKLRADRANGVVVAAYRREEKDNTMKLLDNYLDICRRAQVVASCIMIESDQVQKGIVELVNRHSIRRLVMGAVSQNYLQFKNSSSIPIYVGQNAPSYCQIWFVNKDKHLWIREASGELSSEPPSTRATAEFSNSESLQCRESKILFNQDSLPSESGRSGNGVHNEPVDTETAVSQNVSSSSSTTNTISPSPFWNSFSSSGTSCSGYNSADIREYSGTDSKVEEENLSILLREARLEADSLSKEAFRELVKRKQLEAEAMDAISKLEEFESAHAHEIMLKREVEGALTTVLEEQQSVLKEREEITRELQKTTTNNLLLEYRAQAANHRHDEASIELKIIQTSIAALQQETERIRKQKIEALSWLGRLRSHSQAKASKRDGAIEDLPALAEISLLDLQTATCNFSESFKLAQGGYGCVYKGEMLGRTVAIRKLHPFNMQRQLEFEKEVQALSKLQHPHLVTLVGVCPEEWCIVYEYLPNGSLQDHLFQNTNNSPMPWQIRTRVIAEIASALSFLHSSKSESVVHGDLKPENILLSSELSSKICGFGICKLISEETLYGHSFRRITEPKGGFPYMDPEFYRNGVLTPKSDVYSFGVLILQLITRKSPVGLVSEIRRTMSFGKLSSILDPSAGEWPPFVVRRLVHFALECCELNSRNRPELTPAQVSELEQLHLSEGRSVPSFFLCPILKDIMHDPQIAADGFTYEGDALREWLVNGRETSPMTNMKLSHLHLTPNHALRVAIQNWLCKS